MKRYVDYIDEPAKGQLLLSFDYIEKEKQEFSEYVKQLPYFEEPKNEKEKMFNYQADYKGGNDESLARLYVELIELATKILNNSRKPQIQHMAFSQREAKAIECADEIIERIRTTRFKKWAVTKSWYSYIVDTLNSQLFLRDAREVFDYDIYLTTDERGDE